MIDGFSYPQDYDIPTEAENAKEYEESQKQRAYEREIREAKRDLEIAKATGDEAAIKAAEQKVAQKQAQMRAYVKKTGRPRRYDREKIAGTKDIDGYRGYRAQFGSDTPLNGKAAKASADKPFKSSYTAATSVKEAEEKAAYFTNDKQFGALGISYDGIDVEVANKINKTITDFYDIYDIEKFGGIKAPKGNTKEGKLIEGATAAYSPIRHSFLLNRKSLKNAKIATAELEKENRVVADFLAHPEKYDTSKMSARALKALNNSKTSGRGTVPTTVEDVINHELGHALEKRMKTLDNITELQTRMSQFAPNISGYACDSWSEYVAESFAAYRKGEKGVDPELVKAFKALERKNNG
jgi:flagellar biosynthesis/type III secretory pathway protein FliH